MSTFCHQYAFARCSCFTTIVIVVPPFRVGGGASITSPSSVDPMGDAVTLNYNDGGTDLRICPVTLQGFVIDGSGGQIAGAGVWANRCDGLQVLGCTVRYAKGVAGIFSKYGLSPLIQNNVCDHDGTGSGNHGIYVSNSVPGAQIIGNTLSNNTGAGLHLNGDQRGGGDGTGLISNALVEGNTVFGNQANGIDADGLTNSTVANNLLYNNPIRELRFYQADAAHASSGNRVYDNTIANLGSSTCVQLAGGATGNVFFDNVFYNQRGYGNGECYDIDSASRGGFQSDWNLVSDCFYDEQSGSYLHLSQWRSNFGQDAHSLLIPNNDPSLLFVNQAGGDYHLKAGSAAVDAGVASFASTGAATTDLDNNPRPQGGGVRPGGVRAVSNAGGTRRRVGDTGAKLGQRVSPAGGHRHVQ